MAQDRPDDDATAMFRPQPSGTEEPANDPISLSKPSDPPPFGPGETPQPPTRHSASPAPAWDPQTAGYAPPPAPYGQSGYDPTVYGQPGYDQPGYGQPAYGPPAYGQPGYPQPGHGYPPGYPRPTNTMAILSLVMAFVFFPLGLVFGIIARNQIKQTGEGGDGLALAGIIISGISIVLAVLIIVIFIVFVASIGAAVGVPG